MKIKRMAILLLIVYVIGLLPSVAFAADGGNNPYETILATSYDYTTELEKWNAKKSGYVAMVGTANFKRYIVFEDVNFDYAPYGVKISNGCNEGQLATDNIFEFRIDDPYSDPIARVYVTECEGWNTPNETVGTITQTITGVHDIYISTNSSNNFYSFQFLGIDPNKFIYKTYNGEGSVFGDTDGHKYVNAINAMMSLGIAEAYSDNSFEPELPLTRADFAMWFARFMTDGIPMAQSCPFVDINPSDRGYNEICYLYDNGIITLNAAKTYNPWTFITVRDASVMILRLLGYETLCGYKGGYPNGYISQARELGLLSGLAPNDYLRRGAAANLLYNSISCEYLDIIGSENGVPLYEKKPGYFATHRNIYKGTGTVTATIFSGLVPGIEVPSKTCYIDNTSYNTGSVSAENYLGVSTEFLYYSPDNGATRTLVHIAPQSRAKQLFLNSKDVKFTKIDRNYINYTDENKKSKSQKISSQAIWIYNNKVLQNDISTVVKPSTFSGRIRLVDNGTGWTVVFIEEYVNIKIQSIDAEKKTISDAIGGEIYNFSSGELIYSDGKSLFEAKDVKRGMLAELYKSYDGKLGILIFGEETLNGAATELTTDGKVIINNLKYNLANELKDNILLGVNCTFYISRHGEVVYYVIDDTTKSIGVLNDIRKKDGKTIISLVTATNTIQDFETVDKLIVDGEKYETYNEVISAVSTVSRYTPCLYRTSADGKIVMLDTAEDNKKNSNDTLVPLNEYNSESPRYYYYRKNLGVFQNISTHELEYRFDKTGTIILQSALEDEDIQIKPISKFSQPYYEQSYIFYSSKRDSKIADIIYAPKIDRYNRSGVRIFDSAVVAVNDEGELGLNIYAYTVDGSETQYWVRETNTTAYAYAKAMEKGDIFLAPQDLSGNIYEFQVFFFKDGKKEIVLDSSNVLKATVNAESGEKTSNSTNTIFGTITEIEGDYYKISSFGSTKVFWYNIVDKKVCCVGADETIKFVSSDTLKLGDKVFLRASASSIGMIVVYE